MKSLLYHKMHIDIQRGLYSSVKIQERSGEGDAELSLMPGLNLEDEGGKLSPPDTPPGHPALRLQTGPLSQFCTRHHVHGQEYRSELPILSSSSVQ